MGKQIRKSTQIRAARREVARRKRAAFEFQQPETSKVLTGKTATASHHSGGLTELSDLLGKHTAEMHT